MGGGLITGFGKRWRTIRRSASMAESSDMAAEESYA
jgi:hypothetical protein